ncbi:hypothetical protein FB451DRAFT_1513195 [Mycena latifolia]|nr:hypothetical protein FB451DRAFT_1513195 [Mycena latifolia]
MSSLHIDKFSVETNTRGVPLIALGKRYTRVPAVSNPPPSPGSPGVALLFAHGTGFHKEIWEPTIEALFAADREQLVREAWAVDCQNHGESAIANEKTLFDHLQLIGMVLLSASQNTIFTVEQISGNMPVHLLHSSALATFRRELIHQEKVIFVAHSAGAVAG